MDEIMTSVVVGTQQSPIDICPVESIFAPALNGSLGIQYLNATAKGHVDQSTLNFVLEPNQHLRTSFRGITYELKKIHFHSCCEHTINGSCPSQHEMHFVHTRTDSTDYLVLAVFFNVSRTAKHRPSLYRWNQAAGVVGASRKTKTAKEFVQSVDPKVFEIDLHDILQSLPSEWYHYQGSLTTYPFSEDVAWIVDRSAGTFKQSDIDHLIGAEQPPRPGAPMALNRRFVLRNCKSEAKGKKQ